jgi:negative regulator of genetic competence, sporulation and motility
MGVNGLKIEKMGQETVKITVSHKELAEYQIDPETLCEDNALTHMFFADVFGEIRRKYAVNLWGMHLFLEVFTLKEDTSMIYISMVSEPEQEADADEKFVYVYFSDRLEDLSGAAREIMSAGNMDKTTESRFYISDEGYFLVIKSDTIIFKTSKAIGAGDYCAEYIEEHFAVIEEEKAVQKLAELAF